MADNATAAKVSVGPFPVGYTELAVTISELATLTAALSSGLSDGQHEMPGKSRWAKRIVRERISQELNELCKHGVSLPLLGPQNLPFVTPHSLPPDQAYGRSGGSHASHAELATAEKDTTTPGLPPRKVCIVGAGAAGLYIAMILDDLNIPNLEYDILEGSERVGGRVFTHHFSEDKHGYYDVGAMRYPDIPTMQRTFDLFRRTKVPLIKYCRQGGDNCVKLFNDRFSVAGENDAHRVGASSGGYVPDDVVDGVDDILEEVFGPYKQAMVDDFEGGFERLMAVDDFSTREYLKRGGPDGTGRRFDFHSIQWMETQHTSTNLFDQAFSESVMDSFDFDTPIDDVEWYCIEGGTSRVTEAMQENIKTKPETKKRVQKIAINRSSKSDGNMEVQVAGESEPRAGYCTVFNTTTLGCLSRIDTSGLDLHPAQKDAIRSLHYDDSVKIALQFSYPWWIVDCGIQNGGTSSTDLPLRTCIYPTYNIHDGRDKPAVLLASYTWAQDATRLGSVVTNTQSHPPCEEELVELILSNLARLHAGKITHDKIKAAYTNVYHAWSWQNDPFTSGAFALYGPSQFSNLYPYLTRPAADSKFHIVGEAASVHHGWLVGSLDSAYCAISKFLYRYRLWNYVALLVERWGEVDELDDGERGTVHLQVALGMLTRDQAVGI